MASKASFTWSSEIVREMSSSSFRSPLRYSSMSSGTSRCTFEDPYQHPLMVFSWRTMPKNAGSWTITSMRGTPTRIAWPPRRAMLIVCSIVCCNPITSKETSAPR